MILWTIWQNTKYLTVGMSEHCTLPSVVDWWKLPYLTCTLHSSEVYMTCCWLPWVTQHLHLYQRKTQNGFFCSCNYFILFYIFFNLFIKEGYLFVCLFVCYVCQDEISQSTAPFIVLLVPWESPGWISGVPMWFHHV